MLDQIQIVQCSRNEKKEVICWKTKITFGIACALCYPSANIAIWVFWLEGWCISIRSCHSRHRINLVRSKHGKNQFTDDEADSRQIKSAFTEQTESFLARCVWLYAVGPKYQFMTSQLVANCTAGTGQINNTMHYGTFTHAQRTHMVRMQKSNAKKNERKTNKN